MKTPTNEQVEQALISAGQYIDQTAPAPILAAEVRRLRDAHASTESTHPADMSKNGGKIDTARIAELEAELARLRQVEAHAQLDQQTAADNTARDHAELAALRTRAETAEATLADKSGKLAVASATLAAVIRAGEGLLTAIVKHQPMLEAAFNMSNDEIIHHYALRDRALIYAHQRYIAVVSAKAGAQGDELAELRKDKERLDWLAINHVEFAEELIRLGWNPACDAQWEKLKLFLRRLRAAIDAAVAGGRAK